MSVGVKKDYKLKLRHLQIGAPSRLRLIRKSAALTKIKLTRDLSSEEKAARRKWMNYQMFDCLRGVLETVRLLW